MATVLQEQGWRAHLRLGFTSQLSATAQRTVVSERKHFGPLLIQKPFYPEGETCHVYLIHPPGGIVGGDSLQLDVNTAAHTHALITTPAATKFYRSAQARANLMQNIKLAKDSALEWLPQESIFDDCNAHMQTRVDLAENSKFTGWEIVCLGRPASKDYFLHGQIRQAMEIWREGAPLLIERTNIQGDSDLLQARWGMQSFTVTATMVSLLGDVDKEIYAALRAVEPRDGICGISQFEYGMVARYLGNNAIAAREYFTKLWAIIRPLQLNRPACLPRIWST